MTDNVPSFLRRDPQNVDAEHYPYVAGSFLDDTSFAFNMAGDVDPLEGIEENILKAHFAAPVWTDYAVVKERPTSSEIATFICDSPEVEFAPLMSDDSVAILFGNEVVALVTVTSIPRDDVVSYLIAFNGLRYSPETLQGQLLFRKLVGSYSILDYPDASLFQKHGLTAAGKGFAEYIRDPDRQRPIFLQRRTTNFPRVERKYASNLRALLQILGVLIVNDSLFDAWAPDVLEESWYGNDVKRMPRTHVIAIPPGDNQPFPLMSDETYGPPHNIDLVLATTPLLQIDQDIVRTAITSDSVSTWFYSSIKPRPISFVRERGLLVAERWAEKFEALRLLLAEVRDHYVDLKEQADELQSQPPVDVVELPALEPLRLDSEGYPIDAADVAEWASDCLPNTLVILPRAAKELAKSRHPNPGQIAKALELLATQKPLITAGERSAVELFNTKLVELKFRDGFSNAVLLRGQTGDAYLVTYEGRRILLDRHLASNQSGFNDPRLIRIYYHHDRRTGRVIVGSMPYHLPTKRS